MLLALVPPTGKTINTYLPMELVREIFLYCMESNDMKSGQLASVCRYWRSVLTAINTINDLPMELMREILLYCIESNQMKSGQLASVCRYWTSAITTMSHLWSTLRVGTWTETEQVVTWLQRAYPKKVIIDPQRDIQGPSEAPMFAALQSSLTSTGKWNELTISSFPPESLASQLGWQVASPMKVLKVLHVEAGCMDSPSFTHLLNLVPTEAPLCEMRLHSPFVTTHFLQPHWFPVLKKLTVLIVNGSYIDEPFELLPTFTQLQIFEADHLQLPFYEPNTNLPLLCTLRKLQLRACSVQWMAGRQFPCLEEMRLHSPIISTHFLQPHWFPVLQNLVVLIVNSRDMNEPFELLPTFTQLQIFEADRLHLPFYEPNTNLPLLCTLRKLRLRACSVQWMAGRQFPFLEECEIFLPRHWEQIQQHEVQLPSCTKLAYHGHPMTTAQYFFVPEMKAMDLRSHDCNEQRVYQQLRHLCRVNGRISNLTTLHLTFQCSEQVLMKVVKYLIPLQELALSITHPSPSFQHFLESLAAKPHIDEWPGGYSWMDYHEGWKKWCSSQTWHVNFLPHLKFLRIQCPKGFSQSERLDNFPLLRAIGWTRAYLTPALEHLKVWEGRGGVDDTAVDYTNTGYLDKHFGISSKEHDATIVRAIVTRRLAILLPQTPLLALYSTALFRQLWHLDIFCKSNHEIIILPYLEQIERLEISNGSIPEYSLNLDLPLTHTLQWLKLRHLTSLWMLGRTFKALREFTVYRPPDESENYSRDEGLQVGLPACTTLELFICPIEYLRFLSCSNVQILRWSQLSFQIFDLAAFNSLHGFLFNLSCLQNLDISVPQSLEIASLIDFVFCGALEQEVWRDIRSVEVEIWSNSFLKASHLLDQTVGHQPRYEKWWKSFTVTKEERSVIIRASM